MTTITMRHSVAVAANLARSVIGQAQAAVDLVVSVYKQHGEAVNRSVWRLVQNLVAQVIFHKPVH